VVWHRKIWLRYVLETANPMPDNRANPDSRNIGTTTTFIKMNRKFEKNPSPARKVLAVGIAKSKSSRSVSPARGCDFRRLELACGDRLPRMADMLSPTRLYELATSRLSLLVPVVYVMGLFALSSVPGTVDPAMGAIPTVFIWVPPNLQNALHVPVFGMLAWLWCWSLRSWTGRFAIRLTAAAGLAGLYAVTDEWYQSTVPGRFASLGDLALNLIGIALGLSLAAALARRRRRLGR